MKRTRSAHKTLQIDARTAVELIVKMSRFSFAAQQHRSARASERHGYPYTAAFQWRGAANMFYDEFSLGDRCWGEWERLTQLPRKFASPIGEAEGVPRS